MKRTMICCWVASCLMCLNMTLAFAQTQNTQGTLNITIDRFEHAQGQALVLLYRSNDELFKEEAAFKTITATIVNGQATIVFENLPFGEYAAVAIHDKNNNGKMDYHWYGHPKEPFGFSKNFRMTMHSGKPKFQDIAVTFSDANSTLTIHLPK